MPWELKFDRDNLRGDRIKISARKKEMKAEMGAALPATTKESQR